MSLGQVTADFDRYRETYDAAVNSSISFSGLTVDFFTRAKAEYITHILNETFGGLSALDLLDVGCGIGNLHPFFASKVHALAGVDVSSECIKTARQLNPWADYRSYDGDRLPFDDGRFDVALTINVMHHVPPQDRKHFVRELRRVVRPGGVGLVFEHNPYNLLTRHAVSSCEFDKDAILLPAGETERLLMEAGFISPVTRFILTIPAHNRSLQHVDRLFGRVPIGAQYYTLGVA